MALMNDRFVTLLRHGEPEGDPVFRGVTDDPLSHAGWSQMQQAFARLDPPDCLASSPLKRCLDFSRSLETAGDIVSVQIEAGLCERDFGTWDGLAADQIDSRDLQKFWENPLDFTPPQAEPLSGFVQRCVNTWDNFLLQRFSRAVLVTHGGVIRAILGSVLEIPLSAMIRIEVPHACTTIIRVPELPGKPSLVQHGVTCHVA